MATAGNQSLYPYRLGVGVTGYTGFIPAMAVAERVPVGVGVFTERKAALSSS